MSERQHTRNIVRLIINSNEHILLAQHMKNGEPFFFLPGGGIEFNETVMDAAERELAEELGINKDQISCLKAVGVYEHSFEENKRIVHEIAIICQCDIKNINSQQDITSMESHLSFKWQQVSQLNKINLLPADFKHLLSKWIQTPVNNEFFYSGIEKNKPNF